MSVDAARLRARRRLIGAVVLVALGVVGFPLLFDTSPRPVAPDISIEMPGQDAAAPPVAKPAPDTAAAPAADHEPLAAARADDAGREGPAAPPTTEPVPAERVADKTVAPPGEAPSARKGAPAAKPDAEAARALATLQGKPAAAAKPEPAAEPREATGRFVVQVGAFSDAGSARELRQRVEKLGLKTYTQAVDTAAGKRIRVRVGPYGERGEADRAAARLKQAGLQPAVLTL